MISLLLEYPQQAGLCAISLYNNHSLVPFFERNMSAPASTERNLFQKSYFSHRNVLNAGFQCKVAFLFFLVFLLSFVLMWWQPQWYLTDLPVGQPYPTCSHTLPRAIMAVSWPGLGMNSPIFGHCEWCAVSTAWVEIETRRGYSAVLTQVKASNCIHFDTSAKHSPTNSEKQAAVLSVWSRDLRIGFKNAEKVILFFFNSKIIWETILISCNSYHFKLQKSEIFETG